MNENRAQNSTGIFYFFALLTTGIYNNSDKELILDKVDQFISKYTGLTINSEKTNKTIFEDSKITDGNNLIYLGFEFDGSITRIKSNTISRYYDRMRKSVLSCARAAKKSKRLGNDYNIRLKKLYSRNTHLGPFSFKNKHSKKYRSNFLKYAYRSAKKMKSKYIKKQIKNHMERLKKYIYLEQCKIDKIK